VEIRKCREYSVEEPQGERETGKIICKKKIKMGSE
jgi:hypothetical protein